MQRPAKPARTIQNARALRRNMSLPEALLWRELRGFPGGLRFRRQHAAGPYVLDFFCARANLAVELDGISHLMGDRAVRDAARDAWLREYRIDTIRIPAAEVLNDAAGVAASLVAYAQERLRCFGKPPPSSLRDATSPSQVDGEDLR